MISIFVLCDCGLGIILITKERCSLTIPIYIAQFISMKTAGSMDIE